jgi:glycerol uptake facilitator-like aquaporin
LRIVFPESVWGVTHLGAPVLAPDVAVGTGIFLEAVLTSFLLLAVFGTAVDPRAPKIGGFAIGLTILMDIVVGGPLTGAAMNPARAFGSELASGFWNDWYVYWIGPIIGGVLAALLYDRVILNGDKQAA